MTYKGYEALVQYDGDAEIFHGEVVNLRDVVTFQGSSAAELKQAFADWSRITSPFARNAGRNLKGNITSTELASGLPFDHRRSGTYGSRRKQKL